MMTADSGTAKFRFVVSVLVWACVVHAFFISRVLLAIPKRGMLSSDWEIFVFYPQVMLMFCLPPGYPFNDQVVSNWKIVGKLVDAFPGSVLYGVAIAFLVNWFVKKVNKTKRNV
jgi:hypothetical protein